MTAEQNKELVRRLVEGAVNPRNPDVLDEVAEGEFALAARRLQARAPQVWRFAIDFSVPFTNNPGRKIIEGGPLPEDHAVYQAHVGQPTHAMRAPVTGVTYFDSTVGGWLCGCGCGEEIFPGEFVRGHEQTALHQRVAWSGTIPRVPALVRRRSSWCRPGGQGNCPAG